MLSTRTDYLHATKAGLNMLGEATNPNHTASATQILILDPLFCTLPAKEHFLPCSQDQTSSKIPENNSNPTAILIYLSATMDGFDMETFKEPEPESSV